MTPSRRTLACGALLVLLAAPAPAQFPPAPGRDWYEETVRHGIRFKPPKDWRFFPTDFSRPNALGRYVPDSTAFYDAKEPGRFPAALWILVFDEEYEPPAAATAREVDRAAYTRYDPDVATWIRSHLEDLRGDTALRHVEEVERDGVNLKGFDTVTEILFRAQEKPFEPEYVLYVWTTVLELSATKRAALLACAPSDRRDWAKWRKGLRSVARTCTRVAVEGLDEHGVAGQGLRARKHRELLEAMQSNPGWELYLTPNYFVVSNSTDREFVEEIQRRLEAIRARFEEDFPAYKALRAAEVRLGRATVEDGGLDEDGEPRTAAHVLDDPIELSRCSVVRVCNDPSDYFKYGGPAGSAGYWSSLTEELVLYDDKAGGGRRGTWATLHHEAFHQFIYYFLGNLAPGTWFNEGNADFYAGHELSRRGTYEVGRFYGRNTTIQEQIRTGRVVPLPSLVCATRNQYYGDEPLEGGTASRYPHGWSFVYFLRTGRRNRAKGWDEEWGTILDRYLDELIESRDVERATAVAFAGVDWEELEKAWSTYVLKGK